MFKRLFVTRRRDIYQTLATLGAAEFQTVLEIGAHHGDDTLKMLSTMPVSRHFAFEPDPRAAAAFEAQVTDPRVSLARLAVGAQAGRASFHQSSGSSGDGTGAEHDASGSLRAPKGHLTRHPWVIFDTAIEVEVTTLDAWFAASGLHQIDFIWADIQGAEIDLIRGGQAALARTRYFYTEYSNDELYEGQANLRDLKRALPGFRLHTRFPQDALFERI